MKVKLKFSVSRPSRGGISIRIEDDASGIEFINGEISLEQFSEAITGLSSRPMIAEIRGIEYIGKNKIVEKRSIECPIKSYNRKELEEWIKNNVKEEGWIVDSYLGSQNSISYLDDKTILNYSVRKYVTPEAEE